MKAFKKILFSSVVIYLIIVVYTTMNIPDFFHDMSHEQYSYSKKLEVVRELADSYNAIVLNESENSLEAENRLALLGKNVLLDSTIIGTETENDIYYVKLDLGVHNSVRVFAKLQCDESLYKSICDFKFKDALLVASINKIDMSDSLRYVIRDEQEILADVGSDILLTGSCLEAVELAAF